jgi:predicted DCC family thiol-disulfide oxidoreductase YuxK
MNAPAQSTATLEVFTDGSCELCRRSRKWVEGRDRHHRLRFVDLRTAETEVLPASRDALASEIWAREPDGTLLSGYSAWRRVLATLPGWRVVAALGALPPLSWLGPPAYRFIARHRNRLPLARHCDVGTCGPSSSR